MLLLLFGATFIALLIAPLVLFTEQKLLIAFTFPLAVEPADLPHRWCSPISSKEQAQRRQIRSALAVPVSTLVEQLAQSPDKLVLARERGDMTIMFGVRGFHHNSESTRTDPQASPRDEQLSTPLTNRITTAKGTIGNTWATPSWRSGTPPLYDPTPRLDGLQSRPRHARRVAAAQPRDARRRGQGQRHTFIPDQLRRGITPAMRGSATWLRPALRTIPCWATSVNLPLVSKASANRDGLPIIIGSRPRAPARGQIRARDTRFIAVKERNERRVGLTAIVGRNGLANSGRFQRGRELNMNCFALSESQLGGRVAAIEQARADEETPIQDAL